MIVCDRCGKEAVMTKTKPRKTDNKVFDVAECQSGCMKEYMGKQYKHTFFPPKNGGKPQAQSLNAGELTTLMAEVLRRVKRIESFVVPGNHGEETVEHDEPTPF